jgi:hypothetical protein
VKKIGRLLGTRDAAAFLRLSPATLRWWRVKGHRAGPTYYKLHKNAVRYSREDLMAWLHERRHGSEAK